jgi:hypothetical protein
MMSSSVSGGRGSCLSAIKLQSGVVNDVRSLDDVGVMFIPDLPVVPAAVDVVVSVIVGVLPAPDDG